MMTENRQLRLNHVHKEFVIEKGVLEVLGDINLEIAGGEFISIVGASGCGKSTLLRTIAGLEKCTSGEIWIGDTCVNKPSILTGMVFQESRLFPWSTVEQNIGFGIHSGADRNEKKEIINEYVNKVGLQGFKKAYPAQLSGGMQQRVSIARALINHPAVLLLDEPFGALDALTRIKMQNEVLDLWEQEKTTMILITHDIDEAIFLSDRILVMEPGRIKKEIKVDMERPRGRNSERFISIRKEIYQEFFKETTIELEYYI